jgi:CBS-domain-containing membrane protein
MTDRLTASTAFDGAEGRPEQGSAQPRRTVVRDVMTRSIVSVRPDTGFDETARILRGNSVRAVPVLDAEGQLLGVVWA